MAAAKKCDICGKLYESYTTEIHFGRINIDGNGIRFARDNNLGTNTIDCCPDCMESIMLHLKNLRGEK